MTNQQSVTSQAKQHALPESWIEALFAKLSAFYGNKFNDMWRGIDPVMIKQTWAESLVVYPPEVLKAALEHCKALPMPPTLPAFMNLCKTEASRPKLYKALPEPAIDKATASARLKQACEKAGMRVKDIV